MKSGGKELTIAFFYKTAIHRDKVFLVAKMLGLSKIHLDVTGCGTRVNTTKDQ